MSDAKASEPSIEDILASIRKIISDDDVETPAPAPVTAAPAPAAVTPEAVIEPVAEEDDDILELTEILEEEPVVAPVEVQDEVVTPVAAEPLRDDEGEEEIASPATVHAAADAFARLSHPKPQPSYDLPTSPDGKSVEDLVREMLKPLLRHWIDDNLPNMVECLVQKELRKISGRPDDRD